MQSPVCGFNFGPSLPGVASTRHVHRQLSCLPVRDHPEAIFEQRLQPQRELRIGHHPLFVDIRVRGLRLDVEAIRVHPVGSADELIRLNVERVSDQIANRLVGADHPPARPRPERGALLTRLVRPDCGHLELRLRTIALDDLRGKARDQERKNEKRKTNIAHERITPRSRKGLTRQSGVGRSAESTTTTSTGPVVGSSFRPSCSCTAVNMDGALELVGPFRSPVQREIHRALDAGPVDDGPADQS